MSSSRRTLAVAVGALLAVLLAGSVAGWSGMRAIGDDNANGGGGIDSLDAIAGQWVSTTGFARDGTQPWTAPVTLQVTGDELRINAGCNSMSVDVEVTDGRLVRTGEVSMTLIGCDAAGQARDEWMAALVEARPQVSLDGPASAPMLTLDTDAGWVGFVRK